MPAHNEVSLLRQSVGVVRDGLRSRGEPFEILVVENGSTDETAALARELAEQAPEVLVRSLAVADYGAAIRDGILSAEGDVIALFDVDYYDLDFLDRGLARLRAADAPPAAIVVASKRAPGTTDTRPWPRRLVTGTFATVLRLAFGLRVSDTHGMKLMQRSDVAPLAEQCRTGTDLFDTELILRAEHAGLLVDELPVTVRELRPSRTPIARRAVRTIVGLVRLRIIFFAERRHRNE
jgi:glycosyltransferase involved in cell wall biosynthesis